MNDRNDIKYEGDEIEVAAKNWVLLYEKQGVKNLKRFCVIGLPMTDRSNNNPNKVRRKKKKSATHEFQIRLMVNKEATSWVFYFYTANL